MENSPLDRFQYYLLPSANPPVEHLEVHNKAFTLWMDIWKEVFKGLGFDDSKLEDDFIRQDLIACICDGDQPVALHLFTFFSLDSKAARSHAYMKQFPEIFFEKLKRKNIRNVMSIEYMTVHPEWRKGKLPVHLGSVLAGLTFNVMKLYGLDACIAPARRDFKVHELAYLYGGEPIISNVLSHNVPCDFLACINGKILEHPSEEVRGAIGQLWSGRVFAADQAQPIKPAIVRNLRRVA